MAQADFSRIATNIGALNALDSLRIVNSRLSIHQARLASGKRINSAEEDPAGLSIATKMSARADGLGVALDNIGDSKNMLSVAEAGLQKISDIMVQMRTKAESAASDTLGTDERAAIQAQLNSWAEEINAIVDTTKWNGQKLLDGLAGFAGNAVTFQVGADTDAANQITLTSTQFAAVYTSNLGIASGTAALANWTQAGAGQNEATGGTAVAAFTGLGELATGTYTIVINAASSVSATMQMKDSGGNLVNLDADGVYGNGYDISATTRTLTLAAGALADVDTGRGFNFDLANVAAGDNFAVTFTYTRGGTYNGDVSTAAGARNAVDNLDAALKSVSTRLGTVGAVSGRLSFREDTTSVAYTNTEAAYSRIMNADMAEEQVESTKYSILQQTSMTMLSQANQMPQNILSLFR